MDQDLDRLRHSTAHLLAASVMQLWPQTKRAIGPSIKDGFYYDFDFGDAKISEADFPKIEKTMRKLLPHWKGFEKKLLSSEEAKAEYPKNSYKHELIDEFSQKGKKKISFYQSGDYTDLCKGGHVQKPAKSLKYFKLLSVAGAYWRGDEKNKMLTRIYGTAWPTKEELDKHLWQLEEAKKRDHKQLGPQLDLFMFHKTSPGMPYWLPKGLKLYNKLVHFWRERHEKYGYQEIASPLLNKSELYKTSGHWKHYQKDMFISDMGKEDIYGVKPMNCPNAMIVFDRKTRSYKDLPLRLSDTDRLHRFERSGTLSGLFRTRSFQQDDAHNFITEEMIEDEYNEIFKIAEEFYGIFDLDFSYRLGTKPEKFLGEKSTWDKAESSLKKLLKKSGKKYSILKEDGAFYGPKVDILMKDAIGREWQMGTIQLDFQQPKRFNLKYTDKNGKQKTPVVIHRVIYGSLERFIGILIEHFAGAFPTWLSPVQVVIVPISDKHLQYARKVSQRLAKARIRVEVDSDSKSMQKRIRNAQIQKTPYVLIVGDKEKSQNSVNVRQRGQKDHQTLSLGKFITQITQEIENKALM